MYSQNFSETGMHTNFPEKTPVKVESNLKATTKEYNGTNNPRKRMTTNRFETAFQLPYKV